MATRPLIQIRPIPQTGVLNSQTLAFPDPTLSSFREDFIAWAEQIFQFANSGGGGSTQPTIGLNVKDFGAVGDFAADDTAAINACLYHAYAAYNQSGTNGTINYEQRPSVYLPNGLYKISGPLAFAYAFDIIGYGAVIIQTDASKDIFNAVNGVGGGISANAKYNVTNLWFVGGKDHISFDSNNTNNVQVNISKCFSINPAGAFVHPGPTHKGLAVVDGAFIWTNESGQAGQIEGGDNTIFRDCYHANKGSNNVFNVVGDVGLAVEDYLSTPGIAGGGAFIKTTGSQGPLISLRRSRIGGEQSQVGIDWQAHGGELRVENLSGPYNNGAPGFKFLGCPDYVDIDLIDAGGTGVYFNPAMTDADKRKLNTIHFRAPGFGYPGDVFAGSGSYAIFDSASDLFALQQVACRGAASVASRVIQTSDLIQGLKIETGFQSLYSSDSSSNHVNTADGTNLFGAGSVIFTATQDGANASIDATYWMRNLPIGQYTLVVDLACDSPILFGYGVYDGSIIRSFPVLPGDPSPHIYFAVGAASAANGRLSIGLERINNAGNVTLSRVRLYSGRVTVPDQRAIVIGTAAPTTGYWQPGDEVIYPVPAAGASPGLVCTAAGFADGGNWATSTAYTRGQHRRANGATYICLQSGTSANAGGGPNSSSYPVVDGTCEWGFLKTGTAPVWKAKAAIAA